ncbi:MAG: universal stress protein [Burkholderiaceae bacterium]|nr:universal stress protein [Burkholderiaceae bacterium]
MFKVLIPVDGSDCAVRAVEYVIKLAREIGPVSVCLLNVYYEPVRLGDVGIAVTPQQMEEVERRQTDPALSTAERFLREAGMSYERDVRAGDVAPAIVKYAQDSACSAIVMGTHGAGALSNLVMGSVAMKVVQLAKVPVTLVK